MIGATIPSFHNGRRQTMLLWEPSRDCRWPPQVFLACDFVRNRANRRAWRPRPIRACKCSELTRWAQYGSGSVRGAVVSRHCGQLIACCHAGGQVCHQGFRFVHIPVVAHQKFQPVLPDNQRCLEMQNQVLFEVVRQTSLPPFKIDHIALRKLLFVLRCWPFAANLSLDATSGDASPR